MVPHTPKSKVKVGIVGCGVVATAYYLPYLMDMDTVELTAVCDLYETRTRACMQLFGAKTQYLDYDDMINKADIDAVFILTAPGTHVPFTMKAVEAGLHVLIQKPLATNMDDARTIAEAVKKAGVKALVEPSANTVLDPDIAQLRDLVKKGVLGDILWFMHASTGPTPSACSIGCGSMPRPACPSASSSKYPARTARRSSSERSIISSGIPSCRTTPSPPSSRPATRKARASSRRARKHDGPRGCITRRSRVSCFASRPRSAGRTNPRIRRATVPA